MACSVEITKVRGITSGGALQRVEVEGTATECELVGVILECPGGELIPDEVAPVRDGEWTATFTEYLADCGCEQSVVVGAYCTSDDTCRYGPERIALPCDEEDREEEECPRVDSERLDEVDFKVEEVGECIDEGKRTITIQIPLTSTSHFEAELQNAEGETLNRISGTGKIILTHTDDYHPGTYRFLVEVTNPSDCDPWPIPITVDVPKCPPDEPLVGICPDINWTKLEADNEGLCRDDGTRRVEIVAEIDARDRDAPFKAHLLDPDGTKVDGLEERTGVHELTHTGHYSPGEKEFEVEISDPEPCGDSSNKVTVDPCCPRIEEEGWNWSVGACQDDGTRPVTAEVTIVGPTSYSAKIKGPDGATTDSVTDATGEKTLTYSEDRDPADGDVEVTVEVTDPEDCESQTRSQAVPACDDEEDGDGGGGRSTLCWLLAILYSMLLGLWLTGIAWGGAPESATGLVGGALFYLLYKFASRCGWCDWAKATLVGLALFVVALIILLVYGEAATWGKAVGYAAGLLVAAINAYVRYC